MTDTAAIATASEFAVALTELRLRSGLTVRGVAKATGLPVSTLGGYFSGRHLPPPSRPEVLESVLEAMSVPPTDRGPWHDALRRLARLGRAPLAPSPYPGLRAFTAAEARDFHGRERLVDELLSLVRGSAGEMVVVLGASGTGKSSLLQAGLVPALDDWAVRLCTPGDDPVARVDAALDELATDAPSCLVLDQVNDLWLVGDGVRQAVLASLRDWLEKGERGPRVVVLGLRSDFYAAAAAEPALLPALRERSLLVGPMTSEELAAAITLPAQRSGREVEPGLVDLLVAECVTRDLAGRTPSLPHMSHCLATMWSSTAVPGRLSTADYRASGGVAGAVARTAETAFAELAPEDQERARKLLLRLVVVDEDLPPTAATIRLRDVSEADQGVLDHFAANRLVTVARHTARLAHEALIDSWPRLRQWVGDSETMLLRHRLVTRETAAWVAADGDPDLLLRGSRLAAALELLGAESPVGLSQDEVAYLRAGSAMEDAHVKAATTRQRRQRLLLLTTTVGMVLALAASVGYVRLNGTLTTERDMALSRGLAVAARSLGDHNPPLAHQVAVAAYQTYRTPEARSALVDSTAEPAVTRILGPAGDRRVAATPKRHLLAVAGGMRTAELYDTSGRLPRKVATIAAPVTSSPGSAIFAVAFSPDGRFLVMGGDASAVRLVDVSDPGRPRQLGRDVPTRGTVYALQVVGDRLYAATAQGGVERWRLQQGVWAPPERLSALPTKGTPLAMSVDAGGRVAVGTDAGAVVYWSHPDSPQSGSVIIPVGKVPVSSVEIEGDGRVLSGSHDGTLAAWRTDATGPAGPEVKASFESWVNAITGVGDIRAAGSSDASLRIWRGPADRRGITIGLRSAVDSIAVLDPYRLAVGIGGGEVDIIDLHNEVLWSGDGGVFFVGFARGSSRLVTASPDAWSVYDTTDLRSVTRVGPPVSGELPGVGLNGTGAVSADGRLVIVGYRDGTFEGYEHDGESARRVFRVADHPAMPESLTVSRDGRQLAVGGDEKVVRLYDLATHPPAPVAVLNGPSNYVMSVTFSPDGQLLAAASIDGNTYVWQRTGSSTWAAVATLDGTGYAEASAFSADGQTLASAGADGVVHLWNVADPSHPRASALVQGPSGDIFQLAFSSRGDLAAATADKSVTVWRTQPSADGAPHFAKYLELAALGQSAYSLAWTDDGRALVAGGRGGVLRIWDTDPRRAIADVCSAVAVPVTDTEWGRLSPDQPAPPTC